MDGFDWTTAYNPAAIALDAGSLAGPDHRTRQLTLG